MSSVRSTKFFNSRMLPGKGRLWRCAPQGFLYEGKLSLEATDEVDSAAQMQVPPPHSSRLRRATFPSQGKASGCSAVNFHAHFPLDAHILSRIAKRRKRMDRRFCGFTDHGDLDDLIFRDEEYEVSRR